MRTHIPHLRAMLRQRATISHGRHGLSMALGFQGGAYGGSNRKVGRGTRPTRNGGDFLSGEWVSYVDPPYRTAYRATGEHPFYVKGKGWTPAASVAVGDLFRSGDDRRVRVESIVDAGESPVYNVRVEEHNTYFVGRPGWDFSLWVYGACNKPETRRERIARSKPVGSVFPSGKLRSRR
jgi:hypothetical protein